MCGALSGSAPDREGACSNCDWLLTQQSQAADRRRGAANRSTPTQWPAGCRFPVSHSIIARYVANLHNAATPQGQPFVGSNDHRVPEASVTLSRQGALSRTTSCETESNHAKPAARQATKPNNCTRCRAHTVVSCETAGDPPGLPSDVLDASKGAMLS